MCLNKDPPHTKGFCILGYDEGTEASRMIMQDVDQREKKLLAKNATVNSLKVGHIPCENVHIVHKRFAYSRTRPGGVCSHKKAS